MMTMVMKKYMVDQVENFPAVVLSLEASFVESGRLDQAEVTVAVTTCAEWFLFQ